MPTPELKWYIAYYPGRDGRPLPYREVSPGLSGPATGDDLATWEVVQALKAQVEALKAAAAKPATPPKNR